MNIQGTWVSNFYHIPEEALTIDKIAASLSKICRFAGNCNEFYSVAQHSVYVSLFLTENPLLGLLHDASEMFIGDIPAPAKQLSDIDNLEEIIQKQIYAHHNVFTHEHERQLHIIDRAIFAKETEELFAHSETPETTKLVHSLFVPERMKSLIIKPWPSADAAALKFIRRYEEIKKISPQMEIPLEAAQG